MSATVYSVVYPTSSNGEAPTRAKKASAIKLGEASGLPFKVITENGVIVHESEASAPVNPKENTMASTTDAVDSETGATAPLAIVPDSETPDEAPTAPSWELEFEGLAKYYFKSAGVEGGKLVGAVRGVEVEGASNTLTLTGVEEDVDTLIADLRKLWPAAKVAHKAWRKTDRTYSGLSLSRKDKEANATRFELEQKYFVMFMTGAADAIANGVKSKKPQSYRDGVTAVNGADDVI